MSKELPAEPRRRKWVAIVTARRNEVWAWIGIGVTILLVAAVRLHRLDLPLERDEGEYAYGAQLILARSFSYATMHTMKLPGVHAAYALILSAFGETPAAIHAGLLLINAASIVLVFLIARRLFDPLTALAAGASFGMLSLGRPVFGLFAHAEHFAMLPALAGTLLLLRSREAPGSSPARDFWSGIAFGVAAIMKQQATVLAGFGVTLLVITEARDLQRSIRPVLCFLLGTVLPYAGVAALFAGRFESFWLWTVQYPRDYVSATTLADGLRNLQAQANRMLPAELGLWSLAALGAASWRWANPLWWAERQLEATRFAVHATAAMFDRPCRPPTARSRGSALRPARTPHRPSRALLPSVPW